MLVAQDPFGSPWMVPMIDILNDIKQEMNAVKVSLIEYSEAVVIGPHPVDATPAPYKDAGLSNEPQTAAYRQVTADHARFAELSISPAESYRPSLTVDIVQGWIEEVKKGKVHEALATLCDDVKTLRSGRDQVSFIG
jgi:hypothetical protein